MGFISVAKISAVVAAVWRGIGDRQAAGIGGLVYAALVAGAVMAW